MATIEVDPKYQALVVELLAQFRARGVFLSEYAEGLLAFSTEAWFEEPPPIRNNAAYEEREMKDMARKIVDSVLQDEHVVASIKDFRGHIKFFDLLVALSDSGNKVLKDFIGKGF